MKRHLLFLLTIFFASTAMSPSAHAEPVRRKTASTTTTSDLQVSQDVAPERDVNFRVNPLGLLLGSLSGDVDFAVTKHLTIGPSLNYFSASLLGTTLSGFGIGLRANLYLSGDAITSGWIVGPTAGYSSFGVSAPGVSASTGGFYAGAVVAYQWVWHNGLNLDLGLGANYYSQSDTAASSDGSMSVSVPFFHGITPTAEVSLGFAI